MGSSRNRMEARPEACGTRREGNHSLWSPLALCLSPKHWARSVHESCGLGTVVRVYQCQIVKKPVNALVRTSEPAATLSRMLKKSANVVLASRRGSTLKRSSSEVGSTVRAFPLAKTYCKGERPTRSAVCTSSPLRSLRPCWTAFLSILLGCSHLATDMQALEVLLCQNGFSQPASRLIPLAERARYG